MNSFTDNFIINGITLTAQPICRQNEVLTPDALEFIGKLHRATADRRQELMQARHARRGQAGRTWRFVRDGGGPAPPLADQATTHALRGAGEIR